MSVMNKIVTLLRGSVREIGESIVDGNASRIYEQEIVDGKQSIDQAKKDLAGVIAKEMQTAREIERLRGEAARYESIAVEALNKREEALAEEVAERVAELEVELDTQTRAHATYALQVQQLKDLIKSAESKIRDHEREIAAVRTTESVYRASQSISDNIVSSGSKLTSARESLERIKKRHEDFADRLAAAEQIDADMGKASLDQKLSAAGIGENADRKRQVLARIKARQGTGKSD